MHNITVFLVLLSLLKTASGSLRELMHKTLLTDTDSIAVCNDGSPAAYYFRPSAAEHHSK